MEIVRQVCAAISEGDEDGIRAVLPPEFEADFSRRLIDGFVLPRDEALANLLGQIAEVWDGLEWEPEQLIDASDKVVARIHVVAQGKSGGVGVETMTWTVWAFRDETPAGLTYFGDDRTGALEAAGLSE